MDWLSQRIVARATQRPFALPDAISAALLAAACAAFFEAAIVCARGGAGDWCASPALGSGESVGDASDGVSVAVGTATRAASIAGPPC